MTLIKENAGVVSSVEQAVKLANEIERAEAALKSMKDALKSFVDKYGPVETTDKVWGYYSSVSWNFEPEKLKDMAQAIVLEGLNPWEMLTFPATSIKKLGWEDSVLAQYGTKKETRRFTSRKR